MKKLFIILASIAFAGSVFAGCPSKPIHGKVVGFDEESKLLQLHKVRKKKLQIGSKTQMVGIDCPSKLKKGLALPSTDVTARTQPLLKLH